MDFITRLLNCFLQRRKKHRTTLQQSYGVARPEMAHFAPRGKSVALMDIGKSRGSEFIDRLEAHFKKAGVATRRYRKPTNTKVAPTELLQKIAAENQLAVIALSD